MSATETIVLNHEEILLAEVVETPAPATTCVWDDLYQSVRIAAFVGSVAATLLQVSQHFSAVEAENYGLGILLGFGTFVVAFAIRRACSVKGEGLAVLVQIVGLFMAVLQGLGLTLGLAMVLLRPLQ